MLHGIGHTYIGNQEGKLPNHKIGQHLVTIDVVLTFQGKIGESLLATWRAYHHVGLH